MPSVQGRCRQRYQVKMWYVFQTERWYRRYAHLQHWQCVITFSYQLRVLEQSLDGEPRQPFTAAMQRPTDHTRKDGFEIYDTDTLWNTRNFFMKRGRKLC